MTKFRQRDYVSDGTREGIVTSGFVSWVGGGTSPITLNGLELSTVERFGRALDLHAETVENDRREEHEQSWACICCGRWVLGTWAGTTEDHVCYGCKGTIEQPPTSKESEGT